MQPRIEIIAEKKLVGRRVQMSFSNDRTFELWRSFMPQRKTIPNVLSPDLFCLQVYGADYDFENLHPHALFEKWAAIEVAGFATVPEHMEPFVLTGGLYAVFIHKCAADAGAATFGYIFKNWLPASGYVVDNRPHFEIMGEKYKNILLRKKKSGYPLNPNYKSYTTPTF